MSNPTALVLPVTLTLRGRPYVVTARESRGDAMPYTLTGVRGARYMAIRNVHSGLLRIMPERTNNTLARPSLHG